MVTKSITSLANESKPHGKVIDQMMSQKEQDPGVIAKPTMAQVVSSGRGFTSQVPNPVIITPAPSNGKLVEHQSKTNHVGHHRSMSIPNANQLIGDGGGPFIA